MLKPIVRSRYPNARLVKIKGRDSGVYLLGCVGEPFPPDRCCVARQCRKLPSANSSRWLRHTLPTEAQQHSSVDSQCDIASHRQQNNYRLADLLSRLYQQNTTFWSLDPTPNSLLKKLLHIVTPLLCCMCNLSLQSGQFAAVGKNVVVCPRLKKPSLDDANSSEWYRTSLLILHGSNVPFLKLHFVI